jgi:collagenase-like PrtC family protease
MINIITHIDHPSQIKKYASLGCKKLVFTTAFLSSGIEHTTRNEAIDELFNQAQLSQIQLGLMVNRLIMESEWDVFIDELEMITIKKLDFFVVSDVGVLHYLSMHTTKEIIFHSDTTIANTHDATMLLNHGATSIMPARELTYQKKYEIASMYPTRTLLPLFGYQIMSKSYRPLLTNYFKEINQTHETKFKPYYFKEERRDHYYIGYEDDHGFCMFTDKIIHLFDEKESLEAIGVSYGWMDANFVDEDMLENAIAYFHDRISKAGMYAHFNKNNQEELLDHGLNIQDTTLVKEKDDE